MGVAVRRREFLALGAAFAGALPISRVLAQAPAGLPRAAVVIGVDRTGGLPVLRAAVSGAVAFADWLAGEQYEIALLTDLSRPLHAASVFDTVAGLVRRGTLGQLVVYFAGHGFLRANNEMWLLSDAPGNPNDAISLDECVDLARYQSGIPNVVFISDACRSIADSMSATLVKGSLVFPNDGPANISKVDLFFAALPGMPAFETAVEESAQGYEGVYTSCFMDAFRNPDRDMIRPLPSGDYVVPNRQLEAYLRREMAARTLARGLPKKQEPDSQVVSGDEVYIARVASGWVAGSQLHTSFGPSLPDVAAFIVAGAAGNHFFLSAPDGDLAQVLADVQVVASETGLAAAYAKLIEPSDSEVAAIQTGFSIRGMRVTAVTTSAGITAAIAGSGLVQIDLAGAPGSSVAIRFEDGSGMVAAVIRDFVGDILVDSDGVTNVSYIPSAASNRWSDYLSERDRLNELRAAVAATANLGVFRIAGRDAQSKGEAAAEFADWIRVLKGIDPTLGVYAAYAYSEAGILEQVRSVREIMLSDTDVDIFDVAMLAGAVDALAVPGVIPFCPVLSRGWGLMRVKGVPTSELLSVLRDHLKPALWTTFDPAGMAIVENVINFRNG